MKNPGPSTLNFILEKYSTGKGKKESEKEEPVAVPGDDSPTENDASPRCIVRILNSHDASPPGEESTRSASSPEESDSSSEDSTEKFSESSSSSDDGPGNIEAILAAAGTKQKGTGRGSGSGSGKGRGTGKGRGNVEASASSPTSKEFRCPRVMALMEYLDSLIGSTPKVILDLL